MNDTLYQHINIVKRAIKTGVTERADLIQTVYEWHEVRGHNWDWENCAKWVDIALATIKLEEKK